MTPTEKLEYLIQNNPDCIVQLIAQWIDIALQFDLVSSRRLRGVLSNMRHKIASATNKDEEQKALQEGIDAMIQLGEEVGNPMPPDLVAMFDLLKQLKFQELYDLMGPPPLLQELVPGSELEQAVNSLLDSFMSHDAAVFPPLQLEVHEELVERCDRLGFGYTYREFMVRTQNEALSRVEGTRAVLKMFADHYQPAVDQLSETLKEQLKLSQRLRRDLATAIVEAKDAKVEVAKWRKDFEVAERGRIAACEDACKLEVAARIEAKEARAELESLKQQLAQARKDADAARGVKES